MEDFEEVAVDRATNKFLYLFHNMDETLIFLPHGLDRLREFLDHLKSVRHHIQFVMKTDRDGNIPFMDMSIL
jgi:hypothetical protein